MRGSEKLEGEAGRDDGEKTDAESSIFLPFQTISLNRVDEKNRHRYARHFGVAEPPRGR